MQASAKRWPFAERLAPKRPPGTIGAAAAGLEKNDVVVTFDGVPVEDYRQLQRLSLDAEVGKTVKLEIVRNREHKTVELRVAEAPDRMSQDRPAPPRDQLR